MTETSFSVGSSEQSRRGFRRYFATAISAPKRLIDPGFRAALAIVLWSTLAVACGNPPSGNSTKEEPAEAGSKASEQATIHQSLVDDLALQRSAADGGGKAWLVETAKVVTVSSYGTWEVVFEAGPLGVADGGMIYFQVSPFWGWSTPQVQDPSAAGFTEVDTSAEGVVLEPRTLDQQLLGIGIAGGRLEAGEQVRIVYGAGPKGARADRFAESESRFWIAVDGDGDGIRQLIADSPATAVRAGPAARLVVFVPSVADPGEIVRGRVAVLDALGNRGVAGSHSIALRADPSLVEIPTTVRLDPNSGGVGSFDIRVRSEGVVRVSARSASGFETVSNPLQVARGAQRIRWADLQTHSGISDGTGTPEELFAYGRDVAGLDAVALTDHDHWGLEFLDQHPVHWSRILSAVESFDRPGSFVALAGFEWTSWVWGHRHVVFFDDDARLLSVLDPRSDTPRELWALLEGTSALTFAHHSAGGPVPTDWDVPPPAEIEPATEIVSVHGSSEARDTPGLIYRAVPGNYVRDALDRGYQLGFVGSTDGHDGHPGLAHLAGPSGGLAALLSQELTQESLRQSLVDRRTYATNGPRIILRSMLAGFRMGSRIPISELQKTSLVATDRENDRQVLFVRAIGSSPFDRLEVIGRAGVLARVDCGQELDCSLTAVIGEVEVGDYIYSRVVQTSGGAAWSSPFYIVEG